MKEIKQEEYINQIARALFANRKRIDKLQEKNTNN